MYCYCIKNKVNGKRYIGITTGSLTKRFTRHLSDSRNGSDLIFHKAIRKYGESNFDFEWFDEYDCTIEELKQIEIESIKGYNTYCSFNKGYNMTLGGDKIIGKSVIMIKPIIFTIISSFESISEASNKTGIAVNGISNCCNLRNRKAGGFFWAFKDTQINPFTFRKVKVIRNSDKQIKKFISVLELSRKLNVDQSVIHMYCINTSMSGKYRYHYY
jgi:hypothetical protein